MSAPSDLRDVETADVYKGDLLAGRLTRHGDDIEFTYDTSYLRFIESGRGLVHPENHGREGGDERKRSTVFRRSLTLCWYLSRQKIDG